MDEHTLNEIPDSGGRRENGQSGEINPPIRRPYGDTGNLYEIPRIRPDDPPMRYWWVEDETENDPQGRD